jgi:hypothetical protein
MSKKLFLHRVLIFAHRVLIFLQLTGDFALFAIRFSLKMLVKLTQVAAWVPDMFGNFNLVKNHKIANNSATTEAREKISTNSYSSEF